jgi:hypothetical protein
MFSKEIKPDPRDATIALLSAQVNDLLGLLEKLSRSHAEEVKSLTDKLIAVTSPFAWKSMQPAAEPQPTRQKEPTRSYLPGWRPTTRPPEPEEKAV